MLELARRSGWIEVIAGCMFSGKTEELIRRVNRARIARQKVQVFKPSIDNRYSKTDVASHSDVRCQSTPIHKISELIPLVDDDTRVVGIDEAQFFDEAILSVSERLAKRGIRVVCAGLDLDFRGQPFGPMPQLLAVAEHVVKLTAVCTVCGNPATRTQRLTEVEEQVVVGAKDSYEARCREHHFVEEDSLAFSFTGQASERGQGHEISPS